MFVYIRSAAFIIVVTQKLVLQQSKNVTAKCTETLSPPPSIQYLLDTVYIIHVTLNTVRIIHVHAVHIINVHCIVYSAYHTCMVAYCVHCIVYTLHIIHVHAVHIIHIHCTAYSTYHTWV